jgi:quercetin dioxygenase-like cupin family protein
MTPQPVNLAAAFASFDGVYAPRVAAELNGQMLKLARIQGRFVMHSHPHEDELFLVQRGELLMHFEDGPTRTIREGEFIVVPRGVRHCPDAHEECWVLLFEPASTLNTGDVGGELTRDAVPLAISTDEAQR